MRSKNACSDSCFGLLELMNHPLPFRLGGMLAVRAVAVFDCLLFSITVRLGPKALMRVSL